MMKQIRFQSGYDLQAKRSRAGLTQQQLADKAECHIQSVRYWEGQHDRESIGGIAGKIPDRLADALGLEPLFMGYVVYEDRPMSAAAREWVFGPHLWLFEPAKPKPSRHCNATKPDGRKCRKSPVTGAARCRQHGGLSTGPKTQEGKARIAKAQRQRWQEQRAAHS